MCYQTEALSQLLITPFQAVLQDVQSQLSAQVDVERVEQYEEMTAHHAKTMVKSATEAINRSANFAQRASINTHIPSVDSVVPLTQAIKRADLLFELEKDSPVVVPTEQTVRKNSLVETSVPFINSSAVADSSNPIINPAESASSVTLPVTAKIPPHSDNQVEANHLPFVAPNVNMANQLTSIHDLNAPAIAHSVPPTASTTLFASQSVATSHIISSESPASKIENEFNTTKPVVFAPLSVDINSTAQPFTPANVVSTTENEVIRTAASNEAQTVAANILNQTQTVDRLNVSSLTTGESIRTTTSTTPAPVSASGIATLPASTVLVPLRNISTSANETNQTGEQQLPSVLRQRFTTAIEPSLQQAYQVTQQQLPAQEANDKADISANQAINNTFNVSVAMSQDKASAGLDLTEFEQALTDVLRTAARRHGLEV